VTELNRRGYFSNPAIKRNREAFLAYSAQAAEIALRHDRQSPETLQALAQKYSQPIFGEIEVYRLLEMLAHCIDPTNTLLYCTSQLTHTLHVVEGLVQAGITDRDIIIAGLVHDVGKLALLTGEAPEYIEGSGKKPIAPAAPGSGLDRCLLTWDHGEIAYARLKDHLSEPCAWLVRYHSINEICLPLMDERDRAFRAKYYDAFHAIDQNYNFFRIPQITLADLKGVIDDAFPKPILF
jgi:hypothetical protein